MKIIKFSKYYTLEQKYNDQKIDIDIDNDNEFKQKTNKIIDLFETLLDEFENYTLMISASDWRSAGNIFTFLTHNIDVIKNFKKITENELMNIFDNNNFSQKEKLKYQEKYPKLYQKYLKIKIQNKFNL